MSLRVGIYRHCLLIAEIYVMLCYVMIPDPAELNVDEKNILVLGDCFLGKQNKADAYCARGRHNNCDTFYISQNYFRLQRQTIQENANVIILFPQDAKKNMLPIVMMTCQLENLRSSVETHGVKVNITL